MSVSDLIEIWEGDDMVEDGRGGRKQKLMVTGDRGGVEHQLPAVSPVYSYV